MPRCGLATIILLLLMLLPACKDQDRLPSQVLLRIDGRTVSLEQFQHDFAQILPRDRVLPKDEEQALRRSYLAQRIDHELLLAEATRRKLSVTPAELQQAIASHLDRYPSGDFERMLADKGLAVEDWQRLLQEQLLVEKVLALMVRDKVDIADEEINAYFAAHRQSFARPEQVKARQITVPDEAQGRQALEMLRQGTPFAEVARRFSISPDADQGGDMGTFARGEMPEAFDKAVFGLPAGRISDLTESDYGYHIFLVEQHLPARPPDLDTVRGEIVAQLRKQQEEQLYQDWLQSLRQEAAIEIDWTLM